MRTIIATIFKVGLLLLAIGPLGCKTKTMTQETLINWGTGISIPSYYPIDLADAAFFFEGGGVRIIYPHEIVSGPWGVSNSSRGLLGSTGNKGKGSKLPNKLYVLWLSIAENQFYQGTFELDTARMYEAIQRGFRMHRLKRPVDGYNLVLGLAPEGRVTLWINGGRQSGQLEIGSYQAWPAPLSHARDLAYEIDKYLYSVKESPEEVPPTDEDYIKALAVNREIVMKMAERKQENHFEIYGVRHGYLDTCHLRYNSRICMEYIDNLVECITDEIYVEYLNGEREVLVLDELVQNPLRMRAVPKEIHCFWSNPEEYRLYEIRFDEDEIIKAYQQAAAELYEGGIELQLLRNDETDFLRVFLRYFDAKDSRKRVEMLHANIQNFVSSERMIKHFETYKQQNKK